MSLMNGLSSAGSGLASYAATYGAEQQKADAAAQLQQSGGVIAGGLQAQRAALDAEQARQADAMLAAREAAGRVQAGGIAATAASTLAATQSAARIQEAAIAAGAPTDAQKNILFYQKMGWIPGGASGDSSAAAQPPASSGGAAASTAPSQSASNSGASATDNPLIRSALGLPKLGSEDDVRAAIVKDINNDPKFAQSSPGERAIELENRLAVGSAKIGSKESLDSIAQQIASYDLSPLDARARMVAGGPGVMAKVKELNPKYNEANYAAVVEAKKAITPGGSLFVPISAMETSLGHASHFLDIANQLGNYGGGNWANVFPNKIASNVGAAPLVNALTQTAFAMAEEGNRIYAGNAGTESAINNWVKTFPVNGSLADQAAAVKNFAQLMGDKFDTMAYHLDKTFKDSGIPPVELLSPKGTATYQRLTSMGPDGKPPQSASTSAATTTTPKPPAVGEVQQGYTFTGGNPADPNSWKAVK